MKCRVVQAMLTAALAGVFSQGVAQKNYYVVVGAFSTEANAKEFKTNLPVLNADTAYATNDDDRVVQLYVLRTSDQDVAIAKSLQLQKSLENMQDQNASYQSISVSNIPEGRTVTVSKAFDNFDRNELISDASSSKAAPSLVSPAPAKAKGKLFKFTVADEQGNPLDGNVHLVDYEKQLDLASYKTSVYTEILNPGRPVQDIAVVCGMFGYKQTEKFMNYEDPSLIDGAHQDDEGVWVIPYKLERLEKGDVSVMYNVSFYKDAVPMNSESEADLKELVKMMKENERYEITVHAHCNGKGDRRIAALGPNKNYFTLEGTQSFYGTAKELTNLRAKAIREYLIVNGIHPRRIKTYGWGGKLMMVDPKSPYSQVNDRIEIEIMKD